MSATLPLSFSEPDINCPAEADSRNPRSVHSTTMTNPLSGPQLCPLTWAVTFAYVQHELKLDERMVEFPLFTSLEQFPLAINGGTSIPQDELQ